ncbi:tRNA guanosine(34) transglycosylase Tgt [Candidatus Dojkabacteria bacterium]|uniref:tRNA guanosine(34) transglycosylase Tgt n=1 Tax=Candidatus Dojkabacteria bacterium TaxID=2099670 RepID=A0A847ETW3_9BACT|nr:tRNA guanosine(34) transglycosylase Tgt [Candidatus Dojkabacteria bacterium]
MTNLDILKEKYFFMPDATRGAVRYLTTKQLEETGTEAIVTNTLHLLIHPGPDVIQQLGGIKKMMGWKGIVFTDSGGFQLFSLLHSKKWKGKVSENGATFKSPKEGNTYELTPESSIDIQMKIGSDVLVTLDDCRDTGLSRADAEKSVERTLKWAVRCKERFNNEYGGTKKTGKLLTCVVQGSNYLDLRAYCAKELSKIGFDGYNFGGYVIDKDGELVVDEMSAVIENVPKDTIRYAMGVGKPEDIVKASKIGYNLFDTVLVTRNARHGTLYTSQGVVRIKNSEMALDQAPVDRECNCECCRNYTRAYLHHMLKNGEATALTLLTIHNLTFYQTLIKGLTLL